ncbi:MAG TPA: hypothetical protein VE641_12950 [Chthoniobacterales bacterium]|nr:hypothetical protein [Chthoniobacterales bacterium]
MGEGNDAGKAVNAGEQVSVISKQCVSNQSGQYLMGRGAPERVHVVLVLVLVFE